MFLWTSTANRGDHCGDDALAAAPRDSVVVEPSVAKAGANRETEAPAFASGERGPASAGGPESVPTQDEPLTEAERAYYSHEEKIVAVLLRDLDDLEWIVRDKYWNPDAKVPSAEDRAKLRQMLETDRASIVRLRQEYAVRATRWIASRVDDGTLAHARTPIPSTIPSPKPGHDIHVFARGDENYVVDLRPSREVDVREDWDSLLRAQCALHDRVLWFFRDLRQ